jgi:hypothetical protein
MSSKSRPPILPADDAAPSVKDIRATDIITAKKPRTKSKKIAGSRKKKKGKVVAATMPVSRLNIVTLPWEIRQKILKFLF